CPVGLYVGRIAAEKNLSLIIETFREIRKRIPDFKGVFVGSGPKLEELRREHPDFIFPGVLRGEELATHYASADLFIFPSITETFGNVTLEAMASGLAVVAYDYAAARQHIRNGINGFTAPFDDRQAYLDLAVKAACRDLRELREEARGAARKVRWKKVVKRFEDQLRGLAAREPFELEPNLTPSN
ncbi:MAG: glycosyltransferase, partial [Verrucomicrobiales bacterium]|nr:glycosyltransferase [Verrucomicrobiales bacterium]